MEKAEERKQKNLERIKNYCLMDDLFMAKCFEDNIEGTQLVLRIILGQEDLIVKETHAQYDIKNLQGHSVTLDIFALDGRGRKCNVEVQRDPQGACPRRARYHGSVIDANSLPTGKNFEDAAEIYVIFITETDVLQAGKPIYHIERYVEETGKRWDDGMHMIYVNGRHQDDTPLGKLMRDFACKDPGKMY